AAVAREHFVPPDATLNDARQLLQNEIARQMAVHVVDLLEMVEVEHQKTELAGMSPRAENLAFERLVEVTLVMDLRETIDDGHPVDLFVVLALDVGAGEVLEDGGAELHAIAVRQSDLTSNLLVVHVRAVRRSVVDDEPAFASLFEMRVTARDRVAI